MLPEQADEVAGGAKAAGGSNFCYRECRGNQQFFCFCEPDTGDVIAETHVQKVIEAAGKIAGTHAAQPGCLRGFQRHIAVFLDVGKSRGKLCGQFGLKRRFNRLCGAFLVPVAQYPEKNAADMVSDGQRIAVRLLRVFLKQGIYELGNFRLCKNVMGNDFFLYLTVCEKRQKIKDFGTVLRKSVIDQLGEKPYDIVSSSVFRQAVNEMYCIGGNQNHISGAEPVIGVPQVNLKGFFPTE